MILIIDNYDSFTYNLCQIIGSMYSDVRVFRNDEITISEIRELSPDALIISPGPGYPSQAGISEEAILSFTGEIPVLGICLGHQAIAEVFGGKIVRAQELMHGKSSDIKIDTSCDIFSGLSPVIRAGRYHSLIAHKESLPECLAVTARDCTGQIMGIKHKEYQTYGLQFHPESILTQDGRKILDNFLKLIPGYKSQFDAPGMTDKTQLKQYISLVADRKLDLTQTQAYEAMKCIMSGNATDAQISSLLTAMKMKGETTDEITGFARGMRDMASEVHSCTDAVDIVGTGGDMSNTFNISTTSAIVASAAGAKVAKHGNRSVSSASGAADILESLGVKIASTPEISKNIIERIGISFLFAPSFHSSMKYAAPARRETGIRTIFNILGPLSNPAKTDYILLGTYSKQLLRPMAEVLMNLGIKHALLIYGDDGLDEISVSSTTSVCEIKDGTMNEYSISPEDFGLERASKNDIKGGTPDENADITLGILSGKITGAKRNIVLLNTGAALYTADKASSIKEGIIMAGQAIDSGAALAKLNELIDITNEQQSGGASA
ncbi:MAG: bifunctional anthranilate synthase component II/anthranilate phosphoribosyltransferase [Oscillospiraceae bacterium]|nr:bifunctional anthranilate synthase component II/anthranilate phosphoribosyltransferase [Oscillospiraceae bacterium]